MRARALILALGLTACSAAPRAVAPPRLDLVPCGQPGTEEDSAVLGRRVALVGDTIVVAGEAKGAFVLDGQARRCPSSPSVLVLGRSRAGAPRFAWCVASAAPFPSLVATPGGFALAGRALHDAAVEPPVPAEAPASPARGPEEVSVLRFGADGALRQRAVLARGQGTVAALAALPDGSLIVEGSVIHAPPEPLVVEHFGARVDFRGVVSEIEPRRELPQGAPAVELSPRPAGGLFRAGVERDGILVEILGEGGSRDLRARVPAPGTVVDLAAAAGAGDDDLWLAWSIKTGRGGAARWERRVARVAKNGSVNERSLGHEEVDAHVRGVVPLGPDRAGVLFQARGAAALVAYDVPGADRVTLGALGDDVMPLGVAAEPGAAVLAGWFRGALRAPGGPALAQHRCGLFVGTVSIDEARGR